MTRDPNLRTIAHQIFSRTLAAIDVESVVREHLHLHENQFEVGEEKYDLTVFNRVILIAIGKASLAMARAVEGILGDRVTDGLVVTNAVDESYRLQSSLKRMENESSDTPHLPILIGGHPLPNAASLEAAGKALKILRANDAEETLVLFLISGGGSAMFEQPIDDQLTLADLQAVNQTLVGCGAVISEMNVVRRHLSAVKGGKLAAAAPRSRQISLYVSDVNSDDLTTVASGPTLPDSSTLEDFHRIISRYDLLQQFTPKVAAVIESGKVWGTSSSQVVPEGENQHARRSHHLLLDNRRALVEAERTAADHFNLAVTIADDLVEGDVEEMAGIHLERLELLRAAHPGRTVCLLSGGEVICPVRGDGEGGRNQEFVLRAAIHLDLSKRENVVVLSAGTDGIDGHSPAAGAIADETTIIRAHELGLSPEDYLHNSDSFNFFRKLDDAIITGPTGNNVRDLRISLAR